MTGMRILVTGAAGFIGSHVADLLADDGHEVVAVDAAAARGARRDSRRPGPSGTTWWSATYATANC